MVGKRGHAPHTITNSRSQTCKLTHSQSHTYTLTLSHSQTLTHPHTHVLSCTNIIINSLSHVHPSHVVALATLALSISLLHLLLPHIAHGSFVGSLHLEAHKPVDTTITFGASTRSYTLRFRVTPSHPHTLTHTSIPSYILLSLQHNC